MLWQNEIIRPEGPPDRAPEHRRKQTGAAPKSFRARIGKTLLLCATLLTLICVSHLGPAHAQRPNLLVSAPASLKTALDEINTQWYERTGKRATISYAASSALGKQIEQGAPADL